MSDKGLFHECPWCNYRCNCDDQPCSCCNEEDDMSDKTDMAEVLYAKLDVNRGEYDFSTIPFQGSTKYISEQKHQDDLKAQRNACADVYRDYYTAEEWDKSFLQAILSATLEDEDNGKNT